MSERRISPRTGQRRSLPTTGDGGGNGDGGRRPAESYFDPLFTDATLRPLLIVCVLTISAFGAALVALAIGDRNILAMAALAVAGGLTLFAVDTERRRSRSLRLPAVLLSIWLLSILGGLSYAKLLPA